MKNLYKVVLVVLIGWSFAAVGRPAHAQPVAASSGQDPMSEGEIKKVDKDAGKLTIKHGELKNLGMPGMTMVFRVTDPALLNKVEQGDKVGFVAEKIGGVLTVTAIEAAK